MTELELKVKKGTCPHCDSKNVKFTSYESDFPYSYYEATCNDCGKDFRVENIT